MVTNTDSTVPSSVMMTELPMELRKLVRCSTYFQPSGLNSTGQNHTLPPATAGTELSERANTLSTGSRQISPNSRHRM